MNMSDRGLAKLKDGTAVAAASVRSSSAGERVRARLLNATCTLILLVGGPLSRPEAARAAEQDNEALAKAAQNPVAAMISVPFQNNTFFGVGPHGDTADELNIQPVIPFSVGGWN